MAQKVLYFLAGSVATSGELAEISRLNPQYEVKVLNGLANAQYGATRLIPCDLVAGTIPTEYNALTVLNPQMVLQAPLADTEAVVTNNQKISSVTGSGTFANIHIDPTTKAVTVTLTTS